MSSGNIAGGGAIITGRGVMQVMCVKWAGYHWGLSLPESLLRNPIECRSVLSCQGAWGLRCISIDSCPSLTGDHFWLGEFFLALKAARPWLQGEPPKTAGAWSGQFSLSLNALQAPMTSTLASGVRGLATCLFLWGAPEDWGTRFPKNKKNPKSLCGLTVLGFEPGCASITVSSWTQDLSLISFISSSLKSGWLYCKNIIGIQWDGECEHLLAWCVEDAPKTTAVIITTIIIISLNYALQPMYQKKKKVYWINEFNQVLTSFCSWFENLVRDGDGIVHTFISGKALGLGISDLRWSLSLKTIVGISCCIV